MYHGVRKSMRQGSYSVNFDQFGTFDFNNLMFPLLLKGGDNEILSFLLKQDGLCFSLTDMTSFIQIALKQKWLAGLKTFLWAPVTHFIFSAQELSV
jgi:hypothetical protein